MSVTDHVLYVSQISTSAALSRHLLTFLGLNGKAGERNDPWIHTNFLPVPWVTQKVHNSTDLTVVLIYWSMAGSLARVLCDVESCSVMLLLETPSDRRITTKRLMGVQGVDISMLTAAHRPCFMPAKPRSKYKHPRTCKAHWQNVWDMESVHN